jgi:putative thioredoxin
MTANAAPLDVTDETFQAEVIETSNSMPVVVDFWAAWCGPCQILGPIIESVAAEHKDEVKLAKLDTDANPDTARAFGIQGIPAVKAFRHGKVVAEFTGAVPEPQVRAFFDGLIPNEVEKAAAEASRLSAEDPAAAERKFREALEAGFSVDAIVGLASLLVERGETEEAEELLERAPSDSRAKILRHRVFLARFAAKADRSEIESSAAAQPKDPRSRYRWGVMLAAEGRLEDSLEELLESVRLDRSFEDGVARKAVLAVFDLLGSDSPVTKEYQRRLQMLLF